MIFASLTASAIFFTSYPSMAACNAQIGSISVTITRTSAEREHAADPLTTAPSAATAVTFLAHIQSLARGIASTNDSRQPYLLSDFDFVTDYCTLIGGKRNVP